MSWDGKMTGFLPLVHVRVDFLLDEALDGAFQFLVFLGELHGISGSGAGHAEVERPQGHPLGTAEEREGESEHGAGVAGVDDAVVEQAGRGVKTSIWLSKSR
jgi:hypothetical protein